MQSYGKEQFSPVTCSYKLVKNKFWNDRVKAQGAKVLWLNETKQEAGLDISIHFLLKLYWWNDKRCISMLEPVFQLIIYEYEPEGFEWQAFLIILMLPRQKFYFFAVNSPLTRSIDWLGFYPWNPKHGWSKGAKLCREENKGGMKHKWKCWYLYMHIYINAVVPTTFMNTGKLINLETEQPMIDS